MEHSTVKSIEYPSADFPAPPRVRVEVPEDWEPLTVPGVQLAVAQPFKAGRRGLLLQPGEMDGDSLLGTGLGRIRRADFPAGRGFLVHGGRAMKLQVAQITTG